MTRTQKAAQLVYVLGKLTPFEEEFSAYYERNNIDYVDILELIFFRRQTRQKIDDQLFTLEFYQAIEGVV